MPDTPPTAFDRTTALQTAQLRAYEHAHTAQERYDQAEQLRDRAERTGVGSAYVAPAYARAEAPRAMAETWSRVATALAAGTDGQPAAYDLHVALDHPDAHDLLRRAAADAVRHDMGRG